MLHHWSWLTTFAICACVQTDLGSSRFAIVDGPVEFLSEQDISTGDVRGVSALDTADIDGDGNPDVGVFEGGKHADGRVTFAWFEAPDHEGGDWARHDLDMPSPSRPFIGAAKFGDIDDDGDPDLVVAMDNHSGATMSAYLHWLENPGDVDGEWRSRDIAADLSVHHINDMELADMDGDGRLDVVVRSLEPNQLRFYFQDTADEWMERVVDSSPYGETGEGFALGDLDDDGDVDIAICGHWLETPTTPRSDGFTAHPVDTDYGSVNANVKQAIGDINGDGRMDIVISPAEGYRDGGNHLLAWYEGPPDPRASTSWTQHIVESDFNGGHTVRLADMDRDGDLDLVSGVAWSSWGQTKHVSIYFNRGGSFGEAQVVVNGNGLYTGVVADIGNDGDMDIVGQDTYSATSRPWLYESRESTVPIPDAGLPDAGSTDADSDEPMHSDAGRNDDADANESDSGEPVEGGVLGDGGNPDGDTTLGGSSSSCNCQAAGGRIAFIDREVSVIGPWLTILYE